MTMPSATSTKRAALVRTSTFSIGRTACTSFKHLVQTFPKQMKRFRWRLTSCERRWALSKGWPGQGDRQGNVQRTREARCAISGNRGGRNEPFLHSHGSELSQRVSGDQVTLDVECIVDF